MVPWFVMSSFLLSQAVDRDSDLGFACREHDEHCFPHPPSSLLQQRAVQKKAFHESAPDISEALATSPPHDSRESRSVHVEKTAGPSLVIFSFWVNRDAHFAPKLSSLIKAVQAVRGWRGGAYVVVVSNEQVPRVEADEQVVRPSPECVAGEPGDLCMPWEAIRVLKDYASRGSYSQYAYFEGDILCSAATFDFWRLHVDEFHVHGFLLLPHRRQLLEDGSDVMVDCLYQLNYPECGSALWYKSSSSLLEDSNTYSNEDDNLLEDCPSDRTQVYFQLRNPYTAGFLMNQAQFDEYLVSAASEYNENVSLVREMAAFGLVWDAKYGPQKVATHAEMPVWHLVPLTDTSLTSHPTSEMDSLLDLCLHTCSCPSLQNASLVTITNLTSHPTSDTDFLLTPHPTSEEDSLLHRMASLRHLP